jgi:hypothetical protein
VGSGECRLAGLVPDLIVTGVLEDAASGSLEDPPVSGDCIKVVYVSHVVHVFHAEAAFSEDGTILGAAK